jgi:hypothetical protein
MKYILLMAGAKAGVDAYKEWSEKDIQTHFAHLKRLNKGLMKAWLRRNRLRWCVPGRTGRPLQMESSPRQRSFFSVIGWSMSRIRNEPMRLPHDCRPARAPEGYR